MWNNLPGFSNYLDLFSILPGLAPVIMFYQTNIICFIRPVNLSIKFLMVTPLSFNSIQIVEWYNYLKCFRAWLLVILVLTSAYQVFLLITNQLCVAKWTNWLPKFRILQSDIYFIFIRVSCYPTLCSTPKMKFNESQVLIKFSRCSVPFVI